MGDKPAPAAKGPEWKVQVDRYNAIVGGFKFAWKILRAIMLMQPEKSPELALAKQRIMELQKKIGDAEQTLRAGNIKDVSEKINALGLELKIFRELLIKIESGLSINAIREFSEKKHDTRDQEMIDLLQFYIGGKNIPDSILDKMDFLFTELCCTRVGRKKVIKSQFDIEKILNDIYRKSIPVSDYEQPVADEFKQAIWKIQNAETIEDIVKSEVISTMRDFKKELKDVINNPRVLKTMAYYNITLNNKLLEIFEKETQDINAATDSLEMIRSTLQNVSSEKRDKINEIVDRIESMQKDFFEKQESEGYNLALIVEAAKQRKSVTEFIEKINEISEAPEEEPKKPEPVKKITPPPAPAAKPPEEKPGTQRKTTQTIINEVFRTLLGMEDAREDGEPKKYFIPELNYDLAKMDAWEKSVFLVDLDSMSDERKVYELLQKAIVVTHKIFAEYKLYKMSLPRDQVTAIVKENLELAESIREEIQDRLNKFDGRTTSNLKSIDLLRVKSALGRNIKRLASHSKMEGFV